MTGVQTCALPILFLCVCACIGCALSDSEAYVCVCLSVCVCVCVVGGWVGCVGGWEPDLGSVGGNSSVPRFRTGLLLRSDMNSRLASNVT